MNIILFKNKIKFMPKKVKKGQPKITIKKIETRYLLSDDKGRMISVVVHNDGRMSIFRRNYFNEPFEFNNSKKEIIEAIARLILEAVKLK